MFGTILDRIRGLGRIMRKCTCFATNRQMAPQQAKDASQQHSLLSSIPFPPVDSEPCSPIYRCLENIGVGTGGPGGLGP